MELEDFIKNFGDQFDEITEESFTAETIFKDNEEWSSMTALSIIAMVDEIYSVRLTGDDIRKSITIRDIFTIVSEKSNS